MALDETIPIPGGRSVHGRNAKDFGSLEEAISRTIASGESLIVPADVDESFTKLSAPIDESPPDGWMLVVDPDAPPIDGSGLANGTVVVDFSGSAPASTSVDTDVAKGDTAISVTDESAFAAGDMVKLSSDDSFNPARAAYTKGELGFVASTSAGQVTLDWGTFDSYTSANNATLELIDPTVDVSVEGLRVFGQGPTVGGQQALRMDYGLRSQFVRCEAYECQNVGITMADTLFSEIRECEAHDIRNATTGYGQKLGRASMWSQIVDGYSYRNRTGFDITGSGVSRFCSFVNPRAVDNFERNVTTHGAAEYITWVNPHSGGSGGIGLYPRAPHTTILGGFTVGDAGVGVRTGEGGGLYFRMEGTTVLDSGDQNISLNATDAAHRGPVFIDDVVSEGAFYHGLSTESGFDGVHITGGRFNENNRWGVRLVDASNVMIDTEARNNSQEAAGSYDGVYLQSTGTGGSRAKVEGMFFDDQAAATQRYGFNRDDADYSFTLLDDVIADGNATGGENMTAGTSDAKGTILT